MSQLRICTWNSQGNPVNGQNKNDILQYLYNHSDVLLLQECGNLCIDFQTRVSVLDETETVNAIQAGSYNIRCSSCIISKLPIEAIDTSYLQSGTGRSMIGVCLTQEAINVYNIHAVSGSGGAADVISALGNCNPPFVLGGDMNCTPESLQSGRGHNRSLLYGTSTRHQNFYFAKTGSATRGNKEYDYFIYSPDLTHSEVEKHTQRGGDHYPVFAKFNKRIYG